MITQDIQGLEPGDYVELFEVDFTNYQGGDKLYFHGYDAAGTITWKGVQYEPWSIEATGFARDTSSQQPTPSLRVGNIRMNPDGSAIAGVITALCLQFSDLLGAKVIRRSTMVRYLDAVNFPGGNPEAAPDQEFPPEVWTIECKVHEEAAYLDFELKSALEFDNVELPRRKIVEICSFTKIGGYRGPYCGYTGSAMFDLEGNPTLDPTKDRCSGLVRDCKKRFGEYEELPHGGFPGSDNMRGY